MAWDREAPLERITGESAKANRALWDYAQSGPGRSLRRLHKAYVDQGANGAGSPPTLYLSTITGWSTRHDWLARVAAWEAIQRLADAAAWEERRQAFRERAYNVAERALERVEEMLDYPLARRVVMETVEVEGQRVETVVEIRPASWNIASAARLLAEANKAGRLAVGDPTDTVEERHSGHLVTGPLAALEDEDLNDRISLLLERLGPEREGGASPPPFREGAPPEGESGQPPPAP